MTKARKTRVDSVAGQLQAYRNADAITFEAWPDSVDLPNDLKARDWCLKMFHEIQFARSGGWWKPHQQSELAEFVLLLRERKALIMQLSIEGSITISPKGGRVRSPALDALSALQSSISQIQKSLGLSVTQLANDTHASATGKARAAGGGSRINLLIARPDDDGLLA